jgi:hypothetical protein
MLTATKIQQLAPFSTRKKVALPKILANTINYSFFRGKRRERLVILFFTTIRNQLKTGRNIHEYVPLSQNYLKKMLGENYHLVIADAKKMGVLEVDDHYFFYTDGRKGKCKSYRINQKMFGEDAIELVEYGEELAPLTFVEERTLEVIKNLKVDREGAMLRMEQWIANQEYMSKISVDGKISADLLAAKCRIGNSPTGKVMSLDKQREIAKRNGQHIYHKDKRVRICSEEQFHREKALDTRETWTRSLDELQNGDIYAKVGKNGRLFSNMTSIPGPFLDFIKIEGEVIASIDIKNCQMKMLGKWIREDKKSIGGNSAVVSKERFSDMASSGEIYEKVQEISQLPTRQEAKLATFRALYSSHRAKSKVKTALTKEFPGLIEELDALKKLHGKSFLADTMQQHESEVVINHVLHELFLMGYSCFSKHDSVVCKASQAEEIKSIMSAMLNELVGEHRLEVEYYGN